MRVCIRFTTYWGEPDEVPCNVDGDLTMRRDDLSVDFHPYTHMYDLSRREDKNTWFYRKPCNLHPSGAVRRLQELRTAVEPRQPVMDFFYQRPKYEPRCMSNGVAHRSPTWVQVFPQEARATALAFMVSSRRVFPKDVRRLIGRHIWALRHEAWGPGFL
jgi:hypothetical protein